MGHIPVSPFYKSKTTWLEEKLERTLESQSKRLSLDLPEQVCSSLSEGNVLILKKIFSCILCKHLAKERYIISD